MVAKCAGLQFVKPLVDGWQECLGEYGQRPTELVCGLTSGCDVDGCWHRCGDESQPPTTGVEGGLEEAC